MAASSFTSKAIATSSSALVSQTKQQQMPLRFSGLKAFPNTGRFRNSVSFPAKSFPVLRISCAAAEPATLETVQKIIASQLSVEPSSVTPDAKFSDLGADSLDTVEIMMNLEENFKISIAEDGANNIVTVGDAANMIQDLISKQN